MNENGYPVRGWLNGLLDGLATIDEVETVINYFIEISAKKGYSNGVVDEMNRSRKLSEVLDNIDRINAVTDV